jgi:AcrR family transcriptional regulator
MTSVGERVAPSERSKAGSALEVLRVFLKLGLTSFGGPVAHLGYFRNEFVVQRGWLDERACRPPGLRERGGGYMPYPPEHRKETRARIIRSAQALFNRRGFTSVSIDEVMERAGLTRGGFYNYFRTKSDLYAEAVALALAVTPWSRWDGATVDFAACDAARQVVNAYLSREHFDDVEGSCPMITLPGDVARSGKAVRRAFEDVFKSMAGLFEKSFKREGRANRQCALAIAGICVGGMVVARSVESAELADAIRTAARNTALQLGGWNEDGTIDGPGGGREATPATGRRSRLLRRKSASRG